jgi:hypothetical protein
MSVLTDFFVASPSEVQSMEVDQSPVGRFPGLQAKRTEVVMIVQLQCIVDGSRFEDHLGELDALFVRSETDDGPWIVRIPESLFAFLWSADADAVRVIGTRWAQTEEWKASGGTPDDIVSFLGQICELARVAKSGGKGLYVWMSL